MARNNQKLSRLMKMSWDIQRRKKGSRSQSLQQAWVIVNNGEVTVWYLVQKINPNKEVKWKTLNQFSLFNQ